MGSYVIRHYGFEHIVFSCKVAGIGGFSSQYAILGESAYPSWPQIPEIDHDILEHNAWH